jgi:hypothetical protein
LSLEFKKSRTALIIVDEMPSVTDEYCGHFKFVIRVGFSQYPSPINRFAPLWKQPDNTLLVPLGVASPVLNSTLAFAKKWNGNKNKNKNGNKFDQKLEQPDNEEKGEKEEEEEDNIESGLLASKTTQNRYFIASYAGRSQNVNRENAIKSINEIAIKFNGFA